MFSQPLFVRTSTLKVDQDPSDTIASKRARTEATGSYKALDSSTITVKTVDGKESALFLALVDREEAQFILTTDGPNAILRGFDMVGAKERRPFNSVDPEAKGNYLSVYITVDTDQAAVLEGVSEKIRTEMALAKGVEWFPIVPKNDRYDSSAVNVKVCLAGDEGVLTALKVQHNDSMTAGKGWEFLKDQVEAAGQKNRACAFNGAECMVVTKVRPWKRGDKAGVELIATQLAVKILERKFVDLLPDW